MPKNIREALAEWLPQSGLLPSPGTQFSPWLLAEVYWPQFIDTAEVLFYASLATEEKEATRLSVAWHPGGASDLQSELDETGVKIVALHEMAKNPNPIINHEPWDVLRIQEVGFDVANVAKLSPLVEFGTSALVVGGDGSQQVISGIARPRPHRRDGCVLLHVEAPGVLTIETHGRERFRYERGEVVPPVCDIFAEDSALSLALSRLGGMLPEETPFRTPYARSLVQALTASMRRTRHGGLLLFLDSESLSEELQRVRLRVCDQDILRNAIFELNAAERDYLGYTSRVASDFELDLARDGFDSRVDTVGRLTAVDNAVLIGPGFQVLGAQYEVPSSDAPPVYEAINAQGNHGREYRGRHGSRHRAAECFVSGYEDRIAILSSADGPTRCFMQVEQRVVMWNVRVPVF